MTFGTPPGEQRAVRAAKGTHALMRADERAVCACSRRRRTRTTCPRHRRCCGGRHKRALVVVITNFRDEDSDELAQALRLLRSRHLVLLASLRERIVRELMAQPVARGNAVLDIASAHMYEQSRRERVQPSRRPRRADGGRRAGAARHRAGEPLSRRQAGGHDLRPQASGLRPQGWARHRARPRAAGPMDPHLRAQGFRCCMRALRPCPALWPEA